MAAPQPEATSAPAYTPFVTDVWRLIRAPFTPRAVFEEQREAPTFWIPWLVVGLAFVVLQILQRPFQARVREIVLQHLNQPVPAGGAGAAATLIGLVTGLLTVLILAAICAGIYYVIVTSMGGQMSYKKMLTVTIFAWPIAILQQVLTFVVLSMRGVDSITSVWDVYVSFGADQLLPADANLGAFMRFLLAGIGPLSIWQVTITAVGLQVLGKASKGAAWTAAIVAWAILLVLLSALGAMGMKAAGG